MTDPLLIITDGTDEVNLLSQSSGLRLRDWTPSIPQLKGGGVYHSSPLSDGRALTHTSFENVVDTFNLVVMGPDQDKIIWETQQLRRLLQKAREYWTSPWQGEPVWIEARGSNETNTRYGIIHNWSTPQDDNPFAQPFFACPPIMDNFILTVEHGPWLSGLPGVGECMALSSSEIYGDVLGCDDTTATQDAPDAGNKDANVTYGLTTVINTTATSLITGYDYDLIFGTEKYKLGIVFDNVAIPQGATICSAYIRLVHIGGSGDMDAVIYGENNPGASGYSTYLDFVNRALTTGVQWNDVPLPSVGTNVDTPDISVAVQEIIDLPAWASGHDMGIQIHGYAEEDTTGIRYYASYEHASYTEAQLYVEYFISATTAGQTEATCLEQNYVANKYTNKKLTHIYHWNHIGPAYSSNLINASLPYDLFPASMSAADLVYFGIEDSAGTAPAPFNSLVFDLVDVQDGGATIVWEYWNGAWVTLTELKDHTNTDGLEIGEPFDTLGVKSVHWEQESDWAYTTINAVQAWWVRARVSAGSSTPEPRQQNRHPYTIGWPYVEIAEDEVGGDIPALAKWKFRPVSSDNDAPILEWAGAARIIAGLRSFDRGPNFTAIINLSNTQNVDGITIDFPGASPITSDLTAPTGESWQETYAGAETDTSIGWVEFDFDITREYYGRYRMFLRGKQITGTIGHLWFEAKIVSRYADGQILFRTGLKQFEGHNNRQILDMGIIQFPPSVVIPQSMAAYDDIWIKFFVTSDAGVTYTLYDLVLIPVDEFYFDVYQPNQSSFTLSPDMFDYIDVDGLTIPKNSKTGLLRDINSDRPKTSMPIIGQSRIAVQSNAKQRLWVITTDLLETDKTMNASSHTSVLQVNAQKQQRYLGMRGGR